MSVTSREFQENGIKMLVNANNAFDEDLFDSQLSYLYSARQDIENAILKAEDDKVMKKVKVDDKVKGFDGDKIGTLKHIDNDKYCYIEADDGDCYSSIPINELTKS